MKPQAARRPSCGARLVGLSGFCQFDGLPRSDVSRTHQKNGAFKSIEDLREAGAVIAARASGRSTTLNQQSQMSAGSGANRGRSRRTRRGRTSSRQAYGESSPTSVWTTSTVFSVGTGGRSRVHRALPRGSDPERRTHRRRRLAMVAIGFAVVSGSAGSSIITPTRHDDAQWSLRWLG